MIASVQRGFAAGQTQTRWFTPPFRLTNSGHSFVSPNGPGWTLDGRQLSGEGQWSGRTGLELRWQYPPSPHALGSRSRAKISAWFRSCLSTRPDL